MSRWAFLPLPGAAATTQSRNTAAGRHGFLSFWPEATALPPPSLPNGQESGEAGFRLRSFDLTRDPFSDLPDEAFLYTDAAIRQIYRELINALTERPGIAVLTGEAGTGKTILLQRLCSELRASGHLVIERYRAGLVFDELVAVISGELKISGQDRLSLPSRFCAALDTG